MQGKGETVTSVTGRPQLVAVLYCDVGMSTLAKVLAANGVVVDEAVAVDGGDCSLDAEGVEDGEDGEVEAGDDAGKTTLAPNDEPGWDVVADDVERMEADVVDVALGVIVGLTVGLTVGVARSDEGGEEVTGQGTAEAAKYLVSRFILCAACHRCLSLSSRM